jgi:hypothetical protein
MRESFTFDKNSALRSEGTSKAIRTTGAYIVTLYQCAYRTARNADSKAEMLDFTVGDAEGRKALTGLVLTKRDGSPAFGMNVWNAMLGLMGVTDAKIVQDNVFALNGSHKPGYRIHAVEKKRIGMLLQYVEDKDENGYQVLNDKGYPIYHMVIQCLFDPATNRTFSEIVEGKEAVTLPKLIAKYKDDFAKVAEDSAATEPAQKPTAEGIVDDMPF